MPFNKHDDLWAYSRVNPALDPSRDLSRSGTMIGFGVDWQNKKILFGCGDADGQQVVLELTVSLAKLVSEAFYRAADLIEAGKPFYFGVGPIDFIKIMWDADPTDKVAMVGFAQEVPGKSDILAFPTPENCRWISETLHKLAVDIENGGGTPPESNLQNN